MLLSKIIKTITGFIMITALALVYVTVLNNTFALIASFCTGAYFGFNMGEDLAEDDDI